MPRDVFINECEGGFTLDRHGTNPQPRRLVVPDLEAVNKAITEFFGTPEKESDEPKTSGQASPEGESLLAE